MWKRYLPATSLLGAVAACSMLAADDAGVRIMMGPMRSTKKLTADVSTGTDVEPVLLKKLVDRCVSTTPGWMATAESLP